MVIYVKEHMWPPGVVTAGLFSSMKHVLGALAYGEKHGAAAVRVWFEVSTPTLDSKLAKTHQNQSKSSTSRSLPHPLL